MNSEYIWFIGSGHGICRPSWSGSRTEMQLAEHQVDGCGDGERTGGDQFVDSNHIKEQNTAVCRHGATIMMTCMLR
jgi:hypothetical protein